MNPLGVHALDDPRRNENGNLVPFTDSDGNPAERLDNMAIYVGTGGPRFNLGLDPDSGGASYAMIMVNAADRNYVPDFVEDDRSDILHRIEFCENRQDRLRCHERRHRQASQAQQPLTPGRGYGEPVQVFDQGQGKSREVTQANQLGANMATPRLILRA